MILTVREYDDMLGKPGYQRICGAIAAWAQRASGVRDPDPRMKITQPMLDALGEGWMQA